MARHALGVDDLELVAYCDDTFAVQAGSLLEAVVSFRDKGKGLADGVTVQFGWSLLTPRRRGNELLIREPDFARDPFHDLREDVTTTLAVLASQAAVVNRLGVEPVEVRFDEKVILAKGCLAARRVCLQRSEPRPGDSGWFVRSVEGLALENKPDSYEALFVFEVLRRRASLLQVLALPPGYLAVFDRDGVEAIVDSQNNDVWNTEP